MVIGSQETDEDTFTLQSHWSAGLTKYRKTVISDTLDAYGSRFDKNTWLSHGKDFRWNNRSLINNEPVSQATLEFHSSVKKINRSRLKATVQAHE